MTLRVKQSLLVRAAAPTFCTHTFFGILPFFSENAEDPIARMPMSSKFAFTWVLGKGKPRPKSAIGASVKKREQRPSASGVVA